MRILMYLCRLNDDRNGDDGDEDVDVDKVDWLVASFSAGLILANVWLDSLLFTADNLDIIQPPIVIIIP